MLFSIVLMTCQDENRKHKIGKARNEEQNKKLDIHKRVIRETYPIRTKDSMPGPPYGTRGPIRKRAPGARQAIEATLAPSVVAGRA